MNIQETALAGMLLLTPQRHGDARGFFSESWNRQVLRDKGVDIDFVQDNHSLSAQVGTVRGLHFQTPPHAQDKLVPAGFAHGFVTRAPDTEIIYKCSDYYAPECDRALQWDDPQIGIDWGVTRADVVLSGKDMVAPNLHDLDNPFEWEPA